MSPCQLALADRCRQSHRQQRPRPLVPMHSSEPRQHGANSCWQQDPISCCQCCMNQGHAGRPGPCPPAEAHALPHACTPAPGADCSEVKSLFERLGVSAKVGASGGGGGALPQGVCAVQAVGSGGAAAGVPGPVVLPMQLRGGPRSRACLRPPQAHGPCGAKLGSCCCGSAGGSPVLQQPQRRFPPCRSRRAAGG